MKFKITLWPWSLSKTWHDSCFIDCDATHGTIPSQTRHTSQSYLKFRKYLTNDIFLKVLPLKGFVRLSSAPFGCVSDCNQIDHDTIKNVPEHVCTARPSFTVK